MDLQELIKKDPVVEDLAAEVVHADDAVQVAPRRDEVAYEDLVNTAPLDVFLRLTGKEGYIKLHRCNM